MLLHDVADAAGPLPFWSGSHDVEQLVGRSRVHQRDEPTFVGDAERVETEQIATTGEKRTGNAWPAFEERSFEAFRSYYEYVAKGVFKIEYTLRLNNAGEFAMPPTRAEATRGKGSAISTLGGVVDAYA